MKIFQKDLFDEIRLRAEVENSEICYHIHVSNEQERIKNIEEMSSFYGPILSEIISKYNGDNIPLFGNIMLSTVNRCNGHCSFCVANSLTDKRKLMYIDDKLINNILNQLSVLQYSGRITLNGLNEPFMDNRLVNIIPEIKKIVPAARIHIITNGTLLTDFVLKKIVPYCDKIHVNCYGDGKEIPQRIKDMFEVYKDLKKIKIESRYQKDVLSQFGENECGRKNKKLMDCPCILPYNTISITSSGVVNLCISDIENKYIIGDLRKESLLDIWYGKTMVDYRKKMTEGRKNISLCKECDMFCF